MNATESHNCQVSWIIVKWTTYKGRGRGGRRWLRIQSLLRVQDCQKMTEKRCLSVKITGSQQCQLQTGDMKRRPGNGIEGTMVCTSLGSLLRPLFYFLDNDSYPQSVFLDIRAPWTMPKQRCKTLPRPCWRHNRLGKNTNVEDTSCCYTSSCQVVTLFNTL